MSLAFEEKIAASLKDAICDRSVVELLLPNGLTLGHETEIWDYKLGFTTHPPHRNDAHDIKQDLVKDIVCMHNSYGGYLLIGFPSIFREHCYQFVSDVDHLRDCVQSYANSEVRVRTFVCTAKLHSLDTEVCLVYVPRRSNSTPVFFAKGASEANGKPAFRKNDVWFRDGHRNQLLAERPEKIGFVTGPRELDFRVLPAHASHTLHNLPPRDPNLLKFIGRDEYISKLWAWEGDLRDPIRVLSAIGGSGKTAIAYEFCEQLLVSAATRYDKIVWLTAKSQTFAALLQNYVSTTRTDFLDVDTLCNAILLELACTEEDLAELGPTDKESYLEMLLTDLGVFLVIDDVDSLVPEQQTELFALITRLFYRANARQSSSRVLLTSRLELGAGAAQLVRVSGFNVDEAKDYVGLNAEHLAITGDQLGDLKRNFELLFGASKGSPIFIASIMKLASMGEPLVKAIEYWANQSGEEVRKFAFRREIRALEYRSARVLFAMQILADTTTDELAEILIEDKFSIQDHLGKLRQYQLFASASDPARGVSLSVPEPIRLMAGITEQQLEAKDANDIKARCAKAKNANRSPNVVGRRIAVVSMLWHQSKWEEARLTCERAIKEFPKNGDLNCLLGRTLLSNEINDPKRADGAFKEAYFKKCNRPELADYWAEAKFKLRDWAGVIDVTDLKHGYPVKGRPTALRLSAMYIRATEAQDRGERINAAEQFAAICREGQAILKEGRAESAAEPVERIVAHAASHHIHLLSIDFEDVDNVLQALELIVEYCRDRVRLLSPAYHLIDKLPDFRAVLVEKRGQRFARGNFQAISDKGSAALRFVESKSKSGAEGKLLGLLAKALG
ncbi:MAG: hypothetical protein E5Y06_00800 [Mesorhizobium sp.]|uniref:NB-ARC domain-containing protein n=1 Tax=Mesorhizobium sp. TaxID=1871066 RepID=UPI00121C3838|nr:NB-ARC domain-containing protein [Mesorhizobium sp.]TIN98514.1 MAG: hypothetical protein E5Y06_00800 [Mesorhizobium sp.]TJU99103.1 MAG: hypothetical protein E5Y08_09485 [Mesorhizobium sp.]